MCSDECGVQGNGRSRLAFLIASGLLIACSHPMAYAYETFFVSPTSGRDSPGWGTSPERPSRSLTHALSISSAEDLRIHLDEGVYKGGARPTEDDPERFPLVIPARVLSLEIAGMIESWGSTTFESSSTTRGMFEIEATGPGTASIPRVITIRRVGFRGGKFGVTFKTRPAVDVTEDPENISILFSGCHFTSIAGPGLQLFSTAGWSIDARVESCQFSACGSAAVFHTAAKGGLRASVVDCRIRDLPRLLPGYLLGGALDVHADEGSSVDFVCERNHFFNPHVALAVSTSDYDSDQSQLRILVRNNFVSSLDDRRCGDGEEASERCGLHAGFCLAVWPNHSLDIDIVNNTFLGASDHAVWIDNIDDLDSNGPWSLPVNVLNTVFWQGTTGTSPNESRFWNGSGPAFPGARLSYCVTPPSWGLGETHPSNLEIDPHYTSSPGGEFQMSPGSPCIDSGAPDSHGLAGETDAAGECRFATPNPAAQEHVDYVIDRGAYEFSGECLRVGRFIRGDCDRDADLQMNDALWVFSYLFLGFPETLSCFDACDSNDDGSVDIADGILVLGYLFLGDGGIAAPFPQEGTDDTGDSLPDCSLLRDG